MSKKINLTTIGNFISLIKLNHIWKIDELLKKANINNEELLYLLTILSDIFSKNGDYFLDFNLDIENNEISFNSSTDIFEIETITDLELFKIYTIINTIDIDIDFDTVTKKDINSFNKILTSAFKIYDLKNETEVIDKKMNLNKKTTIEYIKLGNSNSEYYDIEPLLITSNLEGSVLEAYDLTDKKVKTFLINRIVSIGDNVNKKSKQKNIQNEIEVVFELKDESLLLKFKEYKKQQKNYVVKFRNKYIGIEFFIENFTSARVISPNIVKVEVMKRVNLIRKLLSQ